VAWRGLLSQLGLSPQAERGAFNPKAHHHRCARSRRRTRVAKSPRGHPTLLGSFASPYLAVSDSFCPPARRWPTSSHRSRSPASLFVLTTRRHNLSRHGYRPASICAAVSIDTLAAIDTRALRCCCRSRRSPTEAGPPTHHTACVCRTVLLVSWPDPYQCSATAVTSPAAVDEGADMRQTLPAA
jgi:hypothetical protein